VLLEIFDICDTGWRISFRHSGQRKKGWQWMDLASQVAFVPYAMWLQCDRHFVYPKLICNKSNNYTKKWTKQTNKKCLL